MVGKLYVHAFWADTTEIIAIEEGLGNIWHFVPSLFDRYLQDVVLVSIDVQPNGELLAHTDKGNIVIHQELELEPTEDELGIYEGRCTL